VVFLIAASCADGGKEDRPQSEVRITANHHLFGFRGLAGFGTFPVATSNINTDRGYLALADDSTWTVTRPTGTTPADTYALDRQGSFSVFVTGSGREPSVVFRGGYGLVEENEFFFTDRVSTTASPSLGLYFGTRVIPGQAELAGPWHLASLHVVFAAGALLSPDNVARAAHGGVSITTGDPGTVRTISGSGVQSGGASLTFGGSIQNLLTNNNSTGDGTCNLTVSYQTATGTPDPRTFFAAAGDGVVVALDADETDGESGFLFLVKKFDAPATVADITRVAGDYYIGGYTVFVNPTNSGCDAFVGTVSLTAQGGFRLDAVGSRGIDFSYTGTFTLNADGSLAITVPGTTETWFAAVSPDYDTLVLVDPVVETRSNNSPELNLAFAVREKPE
jgi:hypothetical protein